MTSYVFLYHHNYSSRHSWTKAVWQMSKGPKMFSLCIFNMARKTRAHWMIVNGPTENSTSGPKTDT